MPRCTVYSDARVPCGYIIARVWRRHRGPGRWRWAEPNDEQNTRIVTVDDGFPGIASNLGWSPRHAATRAQNRRCRHDGTDGTVDCPCGLSASRMIESARAWIDKHEGRTFDDPGYFDA